jgi:ABC-type branched-subunit amino acid transport system ATPase component
VVEFEAIHLKLKPHAIARFRIARTFQNVEIFNGSEENVVGRRANGFNLFAPAPFPGCQEEKESKNREELVYGAGK